MNRFVQLLPNTSLTRWEGWSVVRMNGSLNFRAFWRAEPAGRAGR